jgi:dolichol-phosphate mannosyltransferase
VPIGEILVVLPAYNEGLGLETLLNRFRDTLGGRRYRIVVVDDGSRDNTPEILTRRAADLPLVVITHPVNRGLAETLWDGLAWVAKNAADDDVVITMDGDDTHDPCYVDSMLKRIEEGNDVVIASRFQPGSKVVGVPPHRQLFSYGVLVLLRLLIPIPGVRDYACGYRATRAAVIRRAVQTFGEKLLDLREWGFICTAELLCKLHTIGARCAEVPFILRYDLKASASHLRAMRTISGYALLVWKIRQARALVATSNKPSA